MADKSDQNNIDDFNRLVGLVFDLLYERFPIAIDFSVEEELRLAKGMGSVIEEIELGEGFPRAFEASTLPCGVSFHNMMWSVMIWLYEEGFVRADCDTRSQNVVLTSKAIAILSISPEGEEPTLGSKLKSAAKSVGTAAGRATLSQTVVQVIGYAFRHVVGV